jgi:Transglycosylase SLT domain/Type IV secretion system pilin
MICYMKKYFGVFIVSFFILFTITAFTTSPVFAQIVPCGDVGSSNGGAPRGVECDVCDLQILAGNIINYFVIIMTVVAALLFVNAGVLYIFSPANPANIAKAHKIFTSTLVGLVIILGAWLIISTVMSAVYDTSFGDWKTDLCKGDATVKLPDAPTPIVQTPSSPLIGSVTLHSAGPGYTSGEFEVDPAYPTGKVLSDSALAKGLGNATTNCTAGTQTCTDFIIAQATAKGVDPNYALALAAVESGGCADPATCKSPAGAVGVIQLMPSTARDVCGATCKNMTDAQMVTYLQDPKNNITLGVEYMRQSSVYVTTQMAAHPERFDSARQADYMAAYYNGGPKALEASNDCGPTKTKYECNINPGGYIETQNYIDRMNTYVNSVNKGVTVLNG